MPYLGLKSAQTINMFANLQLEGGASNHLLFPNGPGPFTYLDDVAVLEAVDGNAKMSGYLRGGYATVYYDLLDVFDRNPNAVISYTRGGERFENVTAETLQQDIDSLLHPQWVRKWFHFQPVRLETPEACNV